MRPWERVESETEIERNIKIDGRVGWRQGQTYGPLSVILRPPTPGDAIMYPISQMVKLSPEAP